MEYEIHLKCIECDGRGIQEHQIAVDEFTDSDCVECDGSGLVMHREIHDSEDDAKADYPDAEYINPSQWNHTKAIQRGKMIANQILGPTLGFKS